MNRQRTGKQIFDRLVKEVQGQNAVEAVDAIINLLAYAIHDTIIDQNKLDEVLERVYDELKEKIVINTHKFSDNEGVRLQ